MLEEEELKGVTLLVLANKQEPEPIRAISSLKKVYLELLYRLYGLYRAYIELILPV